MVISRAPGDKYPQALALLLIVKCASFLYYRQVIIGFVTESEHIGYDAVLGGIFGALAFVLPILFHALGGPAVSTMLLPMFLPILCLAFLVDVRVVLSVVFIVPILSALLTGMPAIIPPILFIMIVEFLVLTMWIYFFYQYLHVSSYIVLLSGAIVDRFLLLVMLYLLENVFMITNGLFSLMLVAKGIPGFVLQLIIIPPLVSYLEPRIEEMRKIR